MSQIGKKTIFSLFLVVLAGFLQEVFATSQVPDKLIFKGDTLDLFANPLEEYSEIKQLKSTLFGEKEGCLTTACWRRYQAEWQLIDDQLYLSAIYSCCFKADGIKADLKQLFGEEYANGKVKADWYSGTVLVPKGKLLHYVHAGYSSIYEKELMLQFVNGRLVNTKEYDNSNSKLSVFHKNDEVLRKFIYSHINWEKLPKLPEKSVRVWIQFSANERGIIDSAKVIKGYNDVFDDEALRVIRSIPEWDVFYRREKFERIVWNFPIMFSEDNKQKYSTK